MHVPNTGIRRQILRGVGVISLGVAGSTAAMGATAPQVTPLTLEQSLPPYITPLTTFGERPDFSPDGKKIVFMSKSWGDALEMDLQTKNIRMLTGYPHQGFLRVQYLPNGDYFLVGAKTFQDITLTRMHDAEIWVLKANAGPNERPVALDQKVFEGVAVSRKTSKIAWANTHGQYPQLIPDGETIIYTADIVTENGQPKLMSKREVIRGKVGEGELEPQDFARNDTELTYSAYRKPWTFSDIKGVNLRTGAVTVYLTNGDEYDEAEGILPDGKHIMVESSRGQKEQSANYIDIWKLALEPNNGRNFTRLTHFGDVEGYKASNPVVSPDGRLMAFHSARSVEVGGVGRGYGIFLLDLTKAK